MRNILKTSAVTIGLGTALLFGTASTLAQPAPGQELKPRPSPAAKVSQQVGITMVEVDYSSPAVKKRKIWGDLVAEGKLWRTGANASTKITFSKDVTIGGKPVPAGTYALLTIPTPKSWTVILNKDVSLGGNMDKYKQDQDVARFTVTPKTAPARERLTFIFSDVTDDAATLDMEWEKVRISIPIKTKATSA
jgi:hypothetical protein